MYVHAAISICIYTEKKLYIYILPFQLENRNRSPGDFPNPFSFCSLCKRKFVGCSFLDKETSGSYPFANGLNGLAHLCLD
jgi:hypothetical protein